MILWHAHEWGWPRRNQLRGIDTQTCVVCGARRDCPLQFVQQNAVQIRRGNQQGDLQADGPHRS